MTPRFHVDGPLRVSAGETVALPEHVAHHAVRVLRLGVGDAITLFDGGGGEYRGTIVSSTKRDTTVRIEAYDSIDRESPLDVTLVQSVLAADAMDYAIRKSVELGVRAIVPVVAVRSQNTSAGGRGERRLQHWRSIAIAACEQSGRNRIPAITAAQALDTWLRSFVVDRPAVIAGPGASTSLAAFATRTPPSAVLIGPEGGFTDAELALATSRQIVPVHLGPRVLRAETAGVAALAMIAAIAGDAR